MRTRTWKRCIISTRTTAAIIFHPLFLSGNNNLTLDCAFEKYFIIIDFLLPILHHNSFDHHCNHVAPLHWHAIVRLLGSVWFVSNRIHTPFDREQLTRANTQIRSEYPWFSRNVSNKITRWKIAAERICSTAQRLPHSTTHPDWNGSFIFTCGKRAIKRRWAEILRNIHEFILSPLSSAYQYQTKQKVTRCRNVNQTRIWFIIPIWSDSRLMTKI